MGTPSDGPPAGEGRAPRVSVVMGVRDGAGYLREAIDSILEQTFTDFEFIIVDDGSRDSTPRILESYSDPRLRIITQRPAGPSAALNRGIAMSAADYIARLDADDRSLPARLARQVAFLDSHPEVALLGTAFREVDSRGRLLAVHRPPTEDAGLRRLLIRRNPFCHSSVMLRRAALETAGLYDVSFPLAEDYDLWLRIAEHSAIAGLPEVLAVYRRHGSALSVTTESLQIRCSIRAMARAIRRGQYPWYAAVYLVRPAAVLATPAPLRRWLYDRIIRSWLRRRRGLASRP